MNTAIGAELDGRLYTDLRELKPDSLITPVSDFYIRTRASRVLPAADDWRIHVRGRRRTVTISAADLLRAAKPIGPKLLECAGNTRGTHFGMISVAQWDGVPGLVSPPGLRHILPRIGFRIRSLFGRFAHLDSRGELDLSVP